MQRSWMMFVVVVLAIVGFAACQNSGAALTESKQLNVFNWASYMPQEVLDDFTKETGITINYEEFDSSETMLAKINAGAKYDVAFPGIDFVPTMIRKDLLLPLDLAKIPNYSNVDASVITQSQTSDSGNKYSLPYNIGSIGVMYWKDKVANPGDSIALLARPDLKGRTIILDDTREVFGAALRSLGFSVNTIVPAEIEAATKVILAWKQNSLMFESDQMPTIFANQEVYVALGYPENVLTDLDPAKRANVGYFLPKEKSAKYLDCMVILKDSKNAVGAHKFINFIYKPENLAKIADMYGYPGISEKAKQFRKVPPHYSADEISGHEFKQPLGADLDLYTKAWEDQIKIGQ